MAYNLISNIGECTLETGFSFVHNNPCNLMTLDNEIMLCDDINYPTDYIEGTTIFTLSDTEMYPEYDIKIPILIDTEYGCHVSVCNLNTDGTATINNSFYNPTFRFSGIKWQINNRYYTPTIGNIYNNGTSPLSAT